MSEEIKISQLQEANEISANDLMMIIQNGVNKKKNIKQMAKELNPVAVSATQPTTNEKVWFRKGKNLLNKNNYFVDALGYVGFVVNLEYGQTYTLSSNLPIIAKFAKESNLSGETVGPQNWVKFTSWTFVAGQNTGNYLNNVVYIGINEKEFQKNVEAYSNYNIQIEQGSTSTEYEAYIEPTIYVKNNNNVYEEFIQESSGAANIDVSTSEITVNKFCKRNKVCTFSAEIKLAQDLSANASVKIMSGLPRTAIPCRVTAVYGANKTCKINLAGGNIYLWYNSTKIASGECLSVFVTYMTE